MPALAQFGPRPRDARRALRALRPGVSLAEVLVSLVIIAILMTSIGSVMVLTSHAVGVSAAQAGEVKTDDVVASLAAEVRLASRILERTPTSISFLCDRDHDGVSDTIRYSWSGVAGDPLLRQLNGGVPVVMVSDCRRFNLSYLIRSTAAAAPVPDVEIGSDVLLYAHQTGSTAAAVNTTNWVAQYFKPNWTAVAPGKTVTAWRITKVEVVASKNAGILVAPWIVRVYSAGADLKPVLLEKRDELTLPVSGMVATTSPSAFIPTGTFTTNSGLDPAKGMCVTVGPNTTSPSGYVGIDASSTDAAGAYMTSTTTGLSYNTPSTTRDMRIRVWGRYKYPGP